MQGEKKIKIEKKNLKRVWGPSTFPFAPFWDPSTWFRF